MKTQARKLINNSQYIPAEWAEQAVLWTAWPSHSDLWADHLEPARAEVAQMIKAVAEAQQVNVLAMGSAAVASAKNTLGGAAEILDMPFGDIWLRDTGPIFTGNGRALRFKTNGWGGKYELPYDDRVGDEIARESGKDTQHFDFILEGGAVEHNGAGALLTTRQCVLNPNRNRWDPEEAEEVLKDALGAAEIFWLEDGLMNDHTDGHIDNIARFVGVDHVLCQSGFGDDDPNTGLYEKIATHLRDMGFTVTQVPSPGRVTDETGSIMPASHMNFIISNSAVIVPDYGAPSIDKVLGVLRDLFPKRRVSAAPSTALLSGGGSFHCITQQEPRT